MLVGFKLDTVVLINVSTCCLSPFTVTEPDEDVEEADDIYGSVVIGGPSAPSWTDIPPPSLFGKEDEPLTTSPRVSPRKTPVTSPAKSSGMSLPSDSPSKVKIWTEYHKVCLWIKLVELTDKVSFSCQSMKQFDHLTAPLEWDCGFLTRSLLVG